MTIHREGYATIAVTLLFFTAVNLLCFHYFYAPGRWIPWGVLGVSLAIWVFILSFFRIPRRRLTRGDQLVICPADGKVVTIEEVVDAEYFHDRRIQVSIFMSPANVHQNRNPVSGEVVYNRYHKGKYLMAWHPKSSTENERHTVVLKTSRGEVLVKQIAGALARRIVNYLRTGQQVEQSAEFGFIKFGSRVDVLIPLGTRIEVRLNQVVQGGVTVLAKFER